MPLRFSSIFALFALLFAGSGWALNLHERLEHAARYVHVSDAIVNASPADTTVNAVPSSGNADCHTCFQLQHLAVALVLFALMIGLFGGATTHAASVSEWPDLAAVASPRSSRGPPALASI